MGKKHIQALIWILAPTWAVLLFIEGVMPFSFAFFKPMAIVTALAVFLVGVFDKWLWRCKWLHPWFVNIPNLSGTWKAKIDSNWVNPETNKPSCNIEAYFVIKQTFSAIKITLLTKESSSDLIGGELVKDKSDCRYCITGVYLNEPKLLRHQQSPIHYGALFCKIITDNNDLVVSGCYWTSRETKGEIEFLAHTKRHYSSFDQCRKAFNTSFV